MPEKIFEDFGCEIYKENEKFFICYDSGESAGSRRVSVDISADEARKAMLSEKDAYEVILAIHNQNLR